MLALAETTTYCVRMESEAKIRSQEVQRFVGMRCKDPFARCKDSLNEVKDIFSKLFQQNLIGNGSDEVNKANASSQIGHDAVLPALVNE